VKLDILSVAVLLELGVRRYVDRIAKISPVEVRLSHSTVEEPFEMREERTFELTSRFELSYRQASKTTNVGHISQNTVSDVQNPVFQNSYYDLP